MKRHGNLWNKIIDKNNLLLAFKKAKRHKERTIYILPFYPDRIVHHAIMNILEPIWDKLFISVSYACRKNKGQHKGSIKCNGVCSQK